MQASRFDQFVRSLADLSRRQVFKAVAGSALASSFLRTQSLPIRARQESASCPPCLPCEVCDERTGRCLPQCGSCEVCDAALEKCRPCAACEICDEFTDGQCVPQCGPCETCEPSTDTCRPCDPAFCETCDPVFGGCRACARCEKCDTSTGECLADCPRCETCDPVLGVCRGCDTCRCETCDEGAGQCVRCDPSFCQRCDAASGSCVEGCSACEECDPSTGACLPRCEQCQECDPARGECRDCLACEKCDEETGRCLLACEERCHVCDPESGECRPCAEDRCEACDEETGQCLLLCCPGEQCEDGGCGQLRENCLTFEAEGPNPRPEEAGGVPLIVDIYWPPGRPVPPYIRAASSEIATIGGFTGLNVGFLTTISMHQPVSALEITVTHSSSPIRATAYASGVPVDSAAMNPALGGTLQTLRLEGAGIDYVEVIAPQDEAVLTKLCLCRLPC